MSHAVVIAINFKRYAVCQHVTKFIPRYSWEEDFVELPVQFVNWLVARKALDNSNFLASRLISNVHHETMKPTKV